ncbi:MAG: DNA-binding protein WhiA [Clostridia bacterium]|nr:DNA-binding protein WhiA [Clostridia bacterium]MBR2418220.1 DNA-binding protein WhiA [Clostridia bacterium]
MSFSSQIKDEILKNSDLPPCCNHAMAYGMLLFGRSFNLSEISLLTDNGAVAERYTELTERVSGVKGKMTVSRAGKYTVDYDSEEERKAILSTFSSSGKEVVQRIDHGNLSNESVGENGDMGCCDISFIKGAFLSCGTASDPNKSYHIEFVVSYKMLSLDLMKMLNDYGIKAKHMVRRYVNVIYIKDSESIEDLLALMGAHNSALEIMNIKIYKDIRNLTNRRINFENANLSKTATAAFDQMQAIETIKENGIYPTLTDELKQIANIRYENPDASLRDIGEMCSPPLSRSAVNHRLKKLISLAKGEANNSKEV